ncbi:hypothetical protein [Rossellomorea aquimaris]|uniref:hypothetical protein n=1 Tax=Rossellomorea aquimaris TaxID=189382 RepID=UPI001653CA4C|nr:hypothetical protein [Rossellomorea aquimaris]
MGFLVFCNTDEQGNITLFVAGPRIIPDKQYEHFFFLTEPIEPSDYKVENGQLVEK